MSSDEEWGSDGELEGDQESGPKFKPSFTLIAIDTHEKMFEDVEAGPLFLQCLEGCHKIARSLIFSEKSAFKSPVGIILAYNDDTKIDLVDFDMPLPDVISKLSGLIQLSNEELKSKYARNEDLDLADFFLSAKQKFMKVGKDAYKRVIVFITNDDNPMGNDAQKRFRALNEAQNFRVLDMSFDLLTTNRNFNYQHLYGELLRLCKTSGKNEIMKDAEDLVSRVSAYIKPRYYEYKIKFYPFKDDLNRYLQLVTVKFIKRAKLTMNAHVTRDTYRKVKKVRETQPETCHELVLPNKTIRLEDHERKQLTENNFPVGLTLFNVSERASEVGLFTRKSSIVRNSIHETSPLFSVFWQYCVDKGRVLTCVRKQRACGKISFAELIPKYVNGHVSFLVNVLPTHSELQLLPDTSVASRAMEAEKAAAAQLITALKFEYHPKLFADPVLTAKRNYLRSQLLDEPVEKKADVTCDDEVNNAIADAAREFKGVVFVEQPLGAKRKAASRSGTRKRKP